MSEMERNVGVLRPIPMTLEGLKKLLPEPPEYLDETCYEEENWEETLSEAFYDKLIPIEIIRVNDDWYMVMERECPDAYESYARVQRLENGDLTFDTFHYNGGAYWVEMVEEGLDKLEKSE